MPFPDDGQHDDGQPRAGEIVQFGRLSQQRSRWLGAVLLTCLAVAAVVTVVARSGVPRPAHSPPPAPSLGPVPAVTNVGHPILGIRAGWELFGLAGSDVVAVQLARGRIVRSAFPAVASSGPVSFVVGKDKVIVRPLDNVPGYVVPDGKPARRLTGILALGGTLLPGPSLSQEWFFQYGLVIGRDDFRREASVVLIGPGGKPTGLALALPSAAHPPVLAMPDGRGDVVLVDYGGAIYDVGPRLLRPVGGVPVAVGPTNWLAVKCAGGACHDLVIDPVTGASRALPGQPVTETPWTYSLGVVAPSGAIAAVVVPGIRDGTGTLELINLATGTKTRVDVPVGDPADRQLAWSPDGQWLLAVTSRGTLAAISMRTGRVQNLRLGMSGLSQIAIRPAPG